MRRGVRFEVVTLALIIFAIFGALSLIHRF